MSLDEEALVAAFRRLEIPLHNALYRLLWETQECQDVMQDAFLRVWAKRAEVDPARVDALLWRSALNLARNRLRWRGLWRWVGLEAREPASGDTPERDAEQATVRRALAQLSQTQREVVLLSEFSGRDTGEIATLLAIPAGTVASRKHHALRRLRELLTPSGETGE